MENILDLYFTNNVKLKLVNRVEVMPPLCLAEHETVFIENSTKPRVNEKPPRLVKQYKKADWEKIKEDMCIFRESSSEKRDEMNTNELWDELEIDIHSCKKKHMPEKKINNRKQSVTYMTYSLRKLKRTRNMSYINSKHQKTNKQRQKLYLC